MGKGFLLLFLISVGIFFSPGKLIAQQKVRVVSGSPIEVVSKDGTKQVGVEVILNDKDVVKKTASKSDIQSKNNSSIQTKSKTRNGVASKTSGMNKSTGVVPLDAGKSVATVKESDNLGKVIKYGPWRMLNNFKMQSFNFAYNAGYIEKETGNRSGGANTTPKTQIRTVVLPDQSSLLKLNQNAQITVVQGQLYSVQVGHFTFNNNAVAALQKISATTTMPVLVIIKNGFYSLLIEGFQNWSDAKLFVGQLDKLGYKGTIVKINNPGKAGTTRI